LALGRLGVWERPKQPCSPVVVDLPPPPLRTNLQLHAVGGRGGWLWSVVDVHLTGTPAGTKTCCRHLGRSGAGANEGARRKLQKSQKCECNSMNYSNSKFLSWVQLRVGTSEVLGSGSRLSGNEIQGFELTFPHMASSSSMSSDKRRSMHGYVSQRRTMQVSFNGRSPHFSLTPDSNGSFLSFLAFNPAW
jgi:hypothetical protein